MVWNADNEVVDGQTPQMAYYARLRSLESCPESYPRSLKKMLAGGPPPPTDADGCMGMVLWFERNRPSARESNRLLDRMCAEGILTETERAEFVVPLSVEAVAECKRRLDHSCDRKARP
ncbi:hypothetical protein FMUBM48_34620 [Nocardia cyriacigeorgica]|nr:hypothetical protein FMUBM48_34620 [Nocardia cyriacigeorgica]